MYIWIVSLIIIFAWVFWIFWSSYFHVKKINIFREDPIINIDRAYGSIDYLRGKNIFLIDSKDIAARLQRAQSSISSIKISTNIPNTLNINLGSYTPLLQTSKHIILSNGSVIDKDSIPSNDIPTIHTSVPLTNYVDFSKNLPVRDLIQISSLLSYATKNIFGFSWDKISYQVTEREILILSGWVIYIFSLDDNIENQVNKIAILEKERGKIGEKKYVYIDMRINGKVFTCSYESEFDCKYNLREIYWESIIQQLQEDVSELIQ